VIDRYVIGEVIHPDATLEAASQKMRASNISALPVCDGQQLVGILTERDLIRRAAAEARAPPDRHSRRGDDDGSALVL
jgi:CBS domain-containing protein